MVPAMVRFTPRNSIVLLAFRGKRTCGAIRFNLPRSDSEKFHSKIASHIVGTLCKLDGVDAVVVAVCTDRAFAGGRAIPHAELAKMLNRRFEQSGFEVRESLCQASDGWASYLDSIVPAGGHPLSEIADSPVAAAVPDDLRPSATEENPPQRVPDADSATMKRTQKRIATYRRLMDRVKSGELDELDELDALPPALDPLGDLPLFAEDALRWDAAEVEANGALLAFMLQGPPSRDLVMLQWATSISVGDQMWNAGTPEGTVDHTNDVDLGDLMFGIGPRPDPGRIENGIKLLLTLVASLADNERRPLLCMLGWLNWALGRGSIAGRYIDEARTIDPQYGMAEVLDTMFSNGMLPEWAFAIESNELS